MSAVLAEAVRGKRVALVIGSGAVQCAAARGMWKVLEREGIGIDMVVGCSGGSIYAAVMALGYDPDTCERLTRELWTPKVTLKRDWRRARAFLQRELELVAAGDAAVVEAP